jgi:hypothetical protein
LLEAAHPETSAPRQQTAVEVSTRALDLR